MQRKVLKCALRFEKLIAERKQTEACKDMNDADILSDLVSRYNSFKANSAIRKWQVSPDQHLAIHGIICGMDSESRALIRSHLDFNKWEESGFLALNNLELKL